MMKDFAQFPANFKANTINALFAKSALKKQNGAVLSTASRKWF